MDTQPSGLSVSCDYQLQPAAALQRSVLELHPIWAFGRQTSMSFHKHLAPPPRSRSTSSSNTQLRRRSAARDFICDSGHMRFLWPREGSGLSFLLRSVKRKLCLTNSNSVGRLSSRSKATGLWSDHACSTHVKAGKRVQACFKRRPNAAGTSAQGANVDTRQ